MKNHRWAIITGEYPPEPGGVSDYTRQVACALARAGDDVHVFAPAWPGELPADAGVRIHSLPDRYSAKSLAMLKSELQSLASPLRVLVQYVPQMYGCRGMNWRFAVFIAKLAGCQVSVMFHEVYVVYERGLPWKLMVFSAATRRMARIIARRADRIFVSTSSWVQRVQNLIGTSRPVTVLPIPSNLPESADSAAITAARAVFNPENSHALIGHFGTYGASVTPFLEMVFPALLERQHHAVALFLGWGSDEFAKKLTANHPALAHRIRFSGGLPPDRLAAALAACDLVIQPYPDGISTRRTSAMASLALGRPVVATSGYLTEPIWAQSAAVVLMPVEAPAQIVEAAAQLLGNPEKCISLGQQSQEFYRRNFSIQASIEKIRAGVDQP